jgi:hypothetical protein
VGRREEKYNIGEIIAWWREQRRRKKPMGALPLPKLMREGSYPNIVLDLRHCLVQRNLLEIWNILFLKKFVSISCWL